MRAALSKTPVPEGSSLLSLARGGGQASALPPLVPLPVSGLGMFCYPWHTLLGWLGTVDRGKNDVGNAVKTLLRRLVPPPLRIFLTTVGFYARFASRYGHLRSRLRDDIIDEKGEPLPWYTYPAIEYLSGLDFSQKTVFEFGCGNSTLYWSARAKQVTAVEHDQGYFEYIGGRASRNVTLIHESDTAAYQSAIERSGARWDVIVIDGVTRTRSGCAALAVDRLAPGGLIILDNSDWFPETARFLREQGLLQVDMHGIVPRGKDTSTTSLFFDRAFTVEPKGERLPIYSKCSKHYLSENDRYPEALPSKRRAAS